MEHDVYSAVLKVPSVEDPNSACSVLSDTD